MSKEHGSVFRQSLRDFPCPVTLGRNTPSFGLHRYKQGLRFVPLDDEGFTLRSDKRRLLYKGRRRSHRFTILGDTAFEYDCILEREPERNVISLLIEGAEKFYFFRQPEFVPDDFLKGSYAVYKKDTLVGEGTGKLCHIHRPLIIDARGRRCWGELAVVGNELRITIPEKWLSEAAYPVIVDPTIGTTTVGSQTVFYDDDNEDWYELYMEASLGVNRFLIPDTFNGKATAYVYAYNTDYDGRCKPVLYSDNGNTPLSRRSANEGNIDIEVRNGKPAGWRSAAFQTNTSIASGNYIWFGLFCDWFSTKFDYGAKFYRNFWDHLGNEIPNTYPMYDANYYYNFKPSMYFTYTSAQNYVRVLTQGVKLTDNRKLTGNYKRSLTQTAKVNAILSRFETIYRKCVMTVQNSMNISRLPVFFRNVAENVKVIIANSESRSISRKCADNVKVNSKTTRTHGIIRKVQDILKGIDTQSFSVLFVRTVADNATVSQNNRHWGVFFRGLRFNAESIAETTHKAEYYRFQKDTVQAAGAVFRGLLLFVRIVTKVFIRDYLLGRFLNAREELILKSAITREIILESKIN